MKMNTKLAALLLSGLVGCAETPVKQAEETLNIAGNKITIINQGGGHYKIGNILVDKQDRSFEVTGKFLRTEPPIEFLAVAKDGKRGYESLLEFDVNVYEFNLACILIGLDTNKGQAPKGHFDPTLVSGDAVEISLSWQHNGLEQEHSASEFFIFNDEKLADGDWVYTGSTFDSAGAYMADSMGGTLVGFVHDPASIIEHGKGFGPQSYGQLKLDNDLMPPVDTPLKATFRYVGNTQKRQ